MESDGSGIQAIFDQRIVKRREDQRPSDPRRAVRTHFERVAQCCSAFFGNNFEAVKAIKTSRRTETKADALSRLVQLDVIANRPVSAAGAGAQRSIESHAGPTRRPKTV